MTSLADQTVLVTGANRGMGREYVAQLLGRGVTKVYAAARDPRTIDRADPRVVPLQLDVTDATSVAGAAAVASDVSVLINNAGIYRATSVLDPDTSNLREELETNLFGPLAMASTFADRIAERSGVIVNVASILAWTPVGASYGVSKAAMWSATDSMRTELGPRGVQVVGVYVGLVDTDMAKFTDYPKSDPADVVRQVLDGIESGAVEVLADEMTRDVRAHGQAASRAFARVTTTRKLKPSRSIVTRARTAVGSSTCRSRRSGTTTYSSRSTRPASISWMQRSRTENSKSSCRTDFHLFSATTSPALWSRWEHGCGASSPVTRSMRDRTRTGSAPSRNSSP